MRVLTSRKHEDGRAVGLPATARTATAFATIATVLLSVLPLSAQQPSASCAKAPVTSASNAGEKQRLMVPYDATINSMARKALKDVYYKVDMKPGYTVEERDSVVVKKGSAPEELDSILKVTSVNDGAVTVSWGKSRQPFTLEYGQEYTMIECTAIMRITLSAKKGSTPGTAVITNLGTKTIILQPEKR